jgi:ABC-type polar amino acid transport system ATPase subunit
MNRSRYAIDVRDVTKVYKSGSLEVQALRGVSFTIEHGEYVAIMGPSGSGKSTLMNVLGCLDRATIGTYLLDDVDVSALDDNALAQIRLKKLGFVFQGFNLLSRTDAIRNVALPLFYAGVPVRERSAAAMARLAEVGLADRGTHKPNELSGGQQQRVAIARALAMRPKLMLFDEPTSALDPENVGDVLRSMRELARSGMTMIVVTHEVGFAREVGDTAAFMDGGVVVESAPPHELINSPRHARTREFLSRVL